MFGKDCFMVKCLSEEGCRVVPDEDLRKSADTALDKQVQYVIKRQYGVKVGEGMSWVKLIFLFLLKEIRK